MKGVIKEYRKHQSSLHIHQTYLEENDTICCLTLIKQKV